MIVYEKYFHAKPRGNEALVDINIFIEYPNNNFFPYATKNWFVPNPECYYHNMSLLDSIDLILCRTHEVEKIFKALNKKTFYIGFTSLDCLMDTEVVKDYSFCLHAQGESPYKGTDTLVNTWKNNMDLPLLTVISHLNHSPYEQSNLKWIGQKVPLDEYRLLQNTCGIHICPSETEGFGHYLVEALSVKAVVITTDAPPMNEYVTDPRCLVSYIQQYPYNLATRFVIDPQHLENTVKNLMLLPQTELNKIGTLNRENYLQKTLEFHNNLRALMNSFE